MLRISELQIIIKETPTESDDPADYTWTRYKGADGENGSDGKDGADGKMEKQVIHTLPMRILRMEKQISLCRTVIVSISVCMRILPSKMSTEIQMITRGHLAKARMAHKGIPGKAGVDGKTPWLFT